MKRVNPMKHLPARLTTAWLISAAAVSAYAAGPAVEEAETDIEIINGVPVNPELKAKLMESAEARSLQELIQLSEQVLRQQQAELDQANADDRSWMGDDPLGHLEGEMHGLVQDIGGGNTADQTQARGEDVVRKMDTLIAMLEEASSACSSCSSSGQGQGQAQGNQAGGNTPAQDSTLAAGPGGSGELNAAGEGNNRFEDLDPAQREAIRRAQQDQQGLPAEYDALLAEYYQRLASEAALDSEPSDDAGNDGNE